MSSVLFSCIGNTDPMNQRNNYHGPMLHIIRNYKPEIVYLYLSREMLEHHKKEDRYVPYIKKMADKLGYSITIKIFERPDLVDVHIFDSFFEDFRDKLKQIHRVHPEKEFLINISSGTPAMNAALTALSSFLEFPTTLIQVATPQAGTHDTPEGMEKALWEILWECNVDNEHNSQRCYEINNKNLNYEIRTEIIKNLIDQYDYEAAYNEANKLQELINKKVIEYLLIQKYRKNLDFPNIYNKLKNVNKKDLLVLDDSRLINIHEYYLKWQSDVEVSDYRGFITGLTPLLSELQKRTIEDYYPDQTRIRNNPQWNNQEWSPHILEIVKESECFNQEVNITSNKFNEIIQKLDNIPVDIKEKLDSLRKAEKVRNKFAHQILKISKEDLENKLGCSIDEILGIAWNLISNLISFSKYDKDKKLSPYRAAYSRINQKIKELL